MPAPAQYEPISMGVALNAEARSTFLRLASSGSASSESAAHTRPSIELGVGVNAESRRLWSAARISGSFSRSSSAASASSPPPAAPAATRPLNSATDIQLAARKASLPSASGLLARWNRLF
jgi:hypothetical protein